ncbi:DUF4192 domain-containing protein [Amycolatopsis sp. 195334CR]|uniref:DUF4192 domain-containing protein n=1 Tax=Amycolatopsis sp. 195334CR TaxID=2814588 RepID=UPI001A8D175B|nr:DUF4192 domain-containing protein [Amycolatopsis sp. 195334CR]MBN6041580.1 DUF4192 domain-containing protein [Amycolatopsis sp. 195334CR]
MPHSRPMATSTRPAAQGRVNLNLSSDPGELIAAVSPILGFRPANSIVVIAHNRGERGRPGSIGHLVRSDLPPPEYALAAAERFVPIVSGKFRVTVLVIGGESKFACEEFVEAAQERFTVAGVGEVHFLWLKEIRTGEPWHCYHEPDCGGELPDLEGGRIAAVAASAGLVTFSSREASVARLDAVDPEAIARRSRQLDAAADKAEPDSRTMVPEQGFAVVRDAIRRAHRGRLELTDKDVLDLVFAMQNTEVRDACLAVAVRPREQVGMAAEQVWLTLVRECPPPERAQFATLLAFSSYLRGDGTFAGMAVDNALAADPGHLLAGLLSRAMEAMLPPDRLADLGRANPALDLDLFTDRA